MKFGVVRGAEIHNFVVSFSIQSSQNQGEQNYEYLNVLLCHVNDL